jgi:hypothetical protein
MEAFINSSHMADNVAEIRSRMGKAARAAGRRSDEVLLCAACKSRTSEIVRISAAFPVDIFGENRMQELLTHFTADAYLGKPCHFIGHLQTNKVNKVVGKASLIHSVDSLRLLDAIQMVAARQGMIQDILVEVNIGGEASKQGATRDEVWRMLDAASLMHNVRVRGLMSIPPAFDNSLGSRRYFAMTRQLLEQAREQHFDNTVLDMLSMGMTASFEDAILEGATIVRIGSGIYGARK